MHRRERKERKKRKESHLRHQWLGDELEKYETQDHEVQGHEDGVEVGLPVSHNLLVPQGLENFQLLPEGDRVLGKGNDGDFFLSWVVTRDTREKKELTWFLPPHAARNRTNTPQPPFPPSQPRRSGASRKLPREWSWTQSIR